MCLYRQKHMTSLGQNVESWALKSNLSVLEQLLLRLYELMRNVHHPPPPIR